MSDIVNDSNVGLKRLLTHSKNVFKLGYENYIYSFFKIEDQTVSKFGIKMNYNFTTNFEN